MKRVDCLGATLAYLEEVVHDYCCITDISLENVHKFRTIQPQQLAQARCSNSKNLWPVAENAYFTTNIARLQLPDNLESPLHIFLDHFALSKGSKA